MLQQQQIEQIRQNFKRIFSLKVGRCAFREIQNIIYLSANNDQDQANFIFESLLTGEISDKQQIDPEAKKQLSTLIDEYCIPLRMAKEIFERGDFIHLITSDLVGQPESPLLLNRLNRVDAEEMQFITDVQSTLHVLNHFLTRVHELSAKDEGKTLADFKAEVNQIKQLASQLPS